MLLPTGLQLVDVVLSVWAAQELNSLLFLLLSVLFAGVALIILLSWTRFRYEIRVGRVLHGYLYSPVLIWRIGVFSYTEHHIPLSDLRHMIVERPIRWFWCDGANITLFLMNGDVFDLGVVSGATKGIELLHTAMPLRTPAWNIVTHDYDALAA
jgi:hypothetical protein